MGHLKKLLDTLVETIETELKDKIKQSGIDTGHTIEKGLKMKGEYYVEGRRIQYITERVLVAGGLHYNHNCVDLYGLIDIIESL